MNSNYLKSGRLPYAVVCAAALAVIGIILCSGEEGVFGALVLWQRAIMASLGCAVVAIFCWISRGNSERIKGLRASLGILGVLVIGVNSFILNLQWQGILQHPGPIWHTLGWVFGWIAVAITFPIAAKIGNELPE